MDRIHEIIEITKMIPDILWYFSSFPTFAYILWKKRDWLKVKMKVINNIISILVLITVARLAIFSLTGSEVSNFVHMDFFGLASVFLEDAVFCFIPLTIERHIRSKWGFFALWGFFSVYFMYEHRGYDIYWQIMTVFYPYYVSRRITMKYSLGTAMVAHVLYDFFTVFTVYFLYWYTIQGVL